MPRTVWYPGHMAKGKRKLEALAAGLDLLIEVRDARAPRLTSSPMLPLLAPKIDTAVVLSKADLAEEKKTKVWAEYLRAKKLRVWPLDLRAGGVSRVLKELAARKPAFRDLRVAVVGIPNVGKSMLINRLAGRRAAPVGGIPGITKGVSWFGGQGFLLADSPGILDPHSDARAHRIISWLGSTRGQIIGSIEEHAKECIEFMIDRDLWSGVEAAWGVKADGEPYYILENIGKRLGKLKSGGVVDMQAAGRIFIDSFAVGKFGRMTLEIPEDRPIWESLEA